MTEDYLPVLEIFYACTEAEPTRRPKAGQVVSLLESIDNKNAKKEGKFCLLFFIINFFQ